MKLQPGDWIRIGSHHTGTPDRRGQVIAVHGADGAPPYEVHWLDTDRTTLFFPGSDCTFDHHALAEPAAV